MADPMDIYWRQPPVSRSVATAVFVTSVAVHIGVLPFRLVAFVPDWVFTIPPEAWRLVTSFMVTGSGIQVLMDTYFLFMYLSQLETSDQRFSRKDDLVWYLIFVCTTILGINYFLTGAPSFLQALILAVCYSATQDQRGARASFYFITIPAQLVPYCMLLVTLLFPGGMGAALVMATGLVAAHLFDFLSRIYPAFSGRRNIIPTPAWLSMLVETPRINERAYGTAFRAPGPEAAGPSPAAGRATGTSGGGGGGGVGGGGGGGGRVGGGILPDSWRTRGPGRRLGE